MTFSGGMWLSYLAILLCHQYASADTIVITKVKCMKVAIGYDTEAMAAIGGLGALIADQPFISFGPYPVTSDGGKSFSDVTYSNDNITELMVQHTAQCIYYIKLCYGSRWSGLHGRSFSDGKDSQLKLEDGEVITSVSGNLGDFLANRITFKTNHRVFGPFGNTSVPEDFDVSAGTQLAYISGRAGDRVDQLSFYFKGGATALGGGAVVVGTGGAAIGTVPITAKAVVAAAASGASAATAFLRFASSQTSGVDHLIININGRKVFPSGRTYHSIRAGQTITPNIRFDFEGGCRIQFIEYDWGSDNDNLGSIDVNADVQPGEDYRIDEGILTTEAEGAVYYVSYRVERNARGGREQWMFCGTASCKVCGERWCSRTSNSGLDRDGDKEDLRLCPTGFSHKGYKRYPQWWPFDDVYLRICANV